MRQEMEEEAEKFLTENAVCGTIDKDFYIEGELR
jgi:hypothetical protein